MRNKLFIVTLYICYAFASAQDIRVSLFNDISVNNLVFSVVRGSYQVQADSLLIGTLMPGNIIYITRKNHQLSIQSIGGLNGVFGKVIFSATDSNSVFQLKPVYPQSDSRSYDDNLEMNIAFHRLQLTNVVNLDKYIAGVVEAEGGSAAPIEYYKAQSVLARTYAVKNIVRHGGENFNLCDGVHCQAFKGRSSMNHDILTATMATRGEVYIDTDSNLITAAFHANSGGQTCNADFVWLVAEPYLKSVEDKWSVNGRGATWSKEISVDEWKKYLQKNGVKLVGNEKASDFVFRQDTRKKYYTFNSSQITFASIRRDFKLRSAYFSVLQKNKTTLLFNGKGYGHGIGMSQEGAMEMARHGFTYRQIIGFYFNGVKPIQISDL